MAQTSNLAMKCKWFICGAYSPQSGKIGTLWLVTTVNEDYFQSGNSQMINSKEYILGKRELWGRGEVVSYELIIRAEVLEL